MPTLTKLGNIAIRLFADDHNPPHFHVVTPDGEVMIEIASLAVLRGSIDRRHLEQAPEWAEQNLEKINAEWQRLNG